MALKRGIDSGALAQPKGTGASGSFKIGQKEPLVKKPIIVIIITFFILE